MSSRPSNGHSSRSHGACAGPWAISAKLLGVELQRVLVGELAALVQADAQALGVELALHLGAAARQLVRRAMNG